MFVGERVRKREREREKERGRERKRERERELTKEIGEFSFICYWFEEVETFFGKTNLFWF